MAQWVKDPALSLLWLCFLQWRRFDPWPGSFHMLQAQPKQPTNYNTNKQTKQLSLCDFIWFILLSTCKKVSAQHAIRREKTDKKRGKRQIRSDVMSLIAQEVPLISEAIHPDLEAGSPTEGFAPLRSTPAPKLVPQSM